MIIPVVGVIFLDEDSRINRQDIIKKLSGREQIFLRREPKNIHDSNAIAVMVKRKVPLRIGYVEGKLAVKLAKVWKKYLFKARISEIRQGDERSGKNWGISIEITKIKRNSIRGS